MLRSVILAGVTAAALTGVGPASAASGLALRPDHTASANGRVAAIVRIGGTVYLGESFTSITPEGRDVRIGAVDAGAGAVTALNPGASSSVRALAVSGSRLFAGGTFSTIGGKPKTRVAKLDATTGAVDTAFSETVYVVGHFHRAAGATREHLAAFDVTVIGGVSQPRFAQFSGTP